MELRAKTFSARAPNFNGFIDAPVRFSKDGSETPFPRHAKAGRVGDALGVFNHERMRLERDLATSGSQESVGRAV